MGIFDSYYRGYDFVAKNERADDANSRANDVNRRANDSATRKARQIELNNRVAGYNKQADGSYAPNAVGKGKEAVQQAQLEQKLTVLEAQNSRLQSIANKDSMTKAVTLMANGKAKDSWREIANNPILKEQLQQKGVRDLAPVDWTNDTDLIEELGFQNDIDHDNKELKDSLNKAYLKVQNAKGQWKIIPTEMIVKSTNTKGYMSSTDSQAMDENFNKIKEVLNLHILTPKEKQLKENTLDLNNAKLESDKKIIDLQNEEMDSYLTDNPDATLSDYKKYLTERSTITKPPSPKDVADYEMKKLELEEKRLEIQKMRDGKPKDEEMAKLELEEKRIKVENLKDNEMDKLNIEEKRLKIQSMKDGKPKDDEMAKLELEEKRLTIQNMKDGKLKDDEMDKLKLEEKKLDIQNMKDGKLKDDEMAKLNMEEKRLKIQQMRDGKPKEREMDKLKLEEQQLKIDKLKKESEPKESLLYNKETMKLYELKLSSTDAKFTDEDLKEATKIYNSDPEYYKSISMDKMTSSKFTRKLSMLENASSLLGRINNTEFDANAVESVRGWASKIMGSEMTTNEVEQLTAFKNLKGESQLIVSDFLNLISGTAVTEKERANINNILGTSNWYNKEEMIRGMNNFAQYLRGSTVNAIKGLRNPREVVEYGMRFDDIDSTLRGNTNTNTTDTTTPTSDDIEPDTKKILDNIFGGR